MNVLLGLIFVSISITFCVCNDGSPIISTNLGDIMGRRIKIQDKEVDQFLGIPYAKPLTKDYRFKKAEPIASYESLIIADTMPPDCPQALTKMSKMMGASAKTIKEDCLFLNIWRPVREPEDTSLREVMFWIYGGGFQMGAISLGFYNGTIISSFGDVIIVMPNYRVGSFGFFTSNSEHEPGNLGLYDQNLALRWVKENIASFGGDPSKVTLFGQSAGSMSITHHISSPYSTGLFRRAILQSGARLSPFFTADAESLMEASLELAKRVKCAKNNEDLVTHHDGIMNCLKNKDIHEILKAEVTLPQNTFLPLIGEDFIPLSNKKGFENFKGDILIGITEEEGNFLILFMDADFQNPKKMMKKKQAVSFTNQLIKRHIKDPEILTATYFDPIDEDDIIAARTAFSEIVADMCFVCPALLYADDYAKEGGNVYFYFFTHYSSKPSPLPSWMRSTHAIDVPYTFGMPVNTDLNYPKIDNEFSKDIMKLFTNFAKGKNPSWKLYEPRYFEAQELNPLKNSPVKIPRAKLCYELWKPALEGQLEVENKYQKAEIKTEL